MTDDRRVYRLQVKAPNGVWVDWEAIVGYELAQQWRDFHLDAHPTDTVRLVLVPEPPARA